MTTSSNTLPTDTRALTDYGFFDGDWDVANRRLRAPLTDGDEWDVFPGSARVSSHLDGLVSIDEISLGALHGVGLRIREAAGWSDRFVAARDGRLQPPMWATDGVHELRGSDVHDGQPVDVRYRWSDIGADRLTWEQAFSTGGAGEAGEAGWETNWVMDLTRRSPSDPVPAPDLPKVTSDFDFLTGSFIVRNQRLRERLTGCTEWLEFEHTLVGRTLLNGMISIDENRIPGVAVPGGAAGGFAAYSALTFRVYDVEAGTWSIHWIDGRAPELGIPVVGGFTDGVGEFYSEEEHLGTPVRVRFLWQPAYDGGPRWEQAFSTDGGSTWETNWVSTFVRRDDLT